MKQLIKEISEYSRSNTFDQETLSALYDKYAPALYGKIVSIINQKEIAEKILMRVFMDAALGKNAASAVYNSFFTSLLNHTRKKTYGTLKALRMFEACSCGSKTALAAM